MFVQATLTRLRNHAQSNSTNNAVLKSRLLEVFR
jgi:hypothetical protein